MNNAALTFVWTYVLFSLGYIHSSGIAGSHDNCVFNISRNVSLFSEPASPSYIAISSV